MNEQSKQWGLIGVLMGGISSEREISLKSGQAVYNALSSVGCQVVAIDITDDQEQSIADQIRQAGIKIAFIALHGRLGEDGTIQRILDDLNVPYTGSDAQSSALAIDKSLTQNLLKKNNIPVPDYVTLTNHREAPLQDIVQLLHGFPLVVKPSTEGSSIGITLVHDHLEMQKAVDHALTFSDEILVEKYIKGRELTIGILENDALPVIEINSTQEFFNFDAKYQSSQTQYTVPAHIPLECSDELKRIALKVHRCIGCSDVSRVDFILDDQNQGYVLEINTIPGFTSTSLLPKAAGCIGKNFEELCCALVKLAYGKKKEISKTS